MIVENDDGGVNEIEERTLTPGEMRSLLHILLTEISGITIPQKTFDEYDPDAQINMTYDETNDLWRFWVPRPRQRGIVVPKKKLRRPIIK